MKPERLITIIREDLMPGYQIAQTAHAVANYCLAYPQQAIKWHVKGNYIISLAAEDLKALELLSWYLTRLEVDHILFFEPDINEHTSIAFVENEKTKLITAQLKLAGNSTGSITKENVEREDQ